jgi:hypothetical protein
MHFGNSSMEILMARSSLAAACNLRPRLRESSLIGASFRTSQFLGVAASGQRCVKSYSPRSLRFQSRNGRERERNCRNRQQCYRESRRHSCNFLVRFRGPTLWNRRRFDLVRNDGVVEKRRGPTLGDSVVVCQPAAEATQARSRLSAIRTRPNWRDLRASARRERSPFVRVRTRRIAAAPAKRKLRELPHHPM